MYAVECPSCRQLLKVKGPLEQAKLKCRYCGEVFIGSSYFVPDDSASGRPSSPGGQAFFSGPSRAAPGGAQPVQQKPFVRSGGQEWMVYVAGAGAVGVIILLILFAHYNSTVEVTERLENGQMITHRVSRTEAAKMKEKEEARRQDIMEAKVRNAMAMEASRNPQANAAAIHSAGGPSPAGRAGPAAGGQAMQPGQQAGAGYVQPKGDPGIKVAVGAKPADAANPEQGFLYGEARNTYAYPLHSLTVVIDVYDNGGNRRGPYSTTIYNVPAQGRAVFSIPYAGISPDQISRMDPIPSVVKADDARTVIWEIDQGTCEKEIEGSAIIVKGYTINNLSEAVKDVKIYGDFFADDGQHVGKVEGVLDENKSTIGPRNREYFTIRFDAANSGIMPQVINSYYLRLVGKKY